MDAEDLVIDSATAATHLVGTQKYLELTKSGLQLVGNELIKHVTPDDKPGLCIVAFPFIPGVKDPVGFMLVLESRTILAWSVGMLRPKSDSVILPITSADQIVHARTVAKTWRQPEKWGLDLVGPPTYHVEVFNDGNMKGAVEMARMVTTGAVSFHE